MINEYIPIQLVNRIALPDFDFNPKWGVELHAVKQKGSAVGLSKILKAGYGSALGRDLTKSKKVQILSTGSRVSRGA